MKGHHRFLLTAIAAILVAGPTGTIIQAAEASEAVASETRAGWYAHIVDDAFVAEYAVVPKPDGVQIIDSRPTKRQFDPGHIPTAISIPDSQFDKMHDQLPADKNTLLIFYCGGVDCMLSHKSAVKAEALGYTNIKVYAAGYPDWSQKGHIGAVSVPFIKTLIDQGAPMTLVDSRPKARKYDKGHIPGAINIPDSQFDKMTNLLPADKAAPLYFYCEGLTCKLSSNSAAKAVALGYTKVMVVPEGYPEWEKLFGPGPTGDEVVKAPMIQPGAESGTISVESFEDVYNNAPGTVYLIDVRDPEEFATGSFKGAINIPINTLEDRIDELPADKPIIFFCGAGGRSGEAYDMVQLYKPALKIYFLDAHIKWTPEGSHTFTGN